MQEKKMKNDAELRKYQDEKNMEKRQVQRTHEVRSAVEDRKMADFDYEFNDW